MTIEKIDTSIPTMCIRGGLTVSKLNDKINELIDAVNNLQASNAPPKELDQMEKTSGLTFEEAMRFLRDGKLIKRRSWDHNYSMCSNSGCWAYGSDIISNDWEIAQ